MCDSGGVAELLPDDVYFGSLPKVLCAGAMLIRDERDRVLLVKPNYTDVTWLLPGGARDPGEDLLGTAHREVLEEVGLDLDPGRLLGVGWSDGLPHTGRPPLLNLIFDGGQFSADDLGRDIVLQASELDEWRLVAREDFPLLLAAPSCDRVVACLDAAVAGTSAGYLPVFH